MAKARMALVCVLATIPLVLGGGCGHRPSPQPHPPQMSGFLDDYSRLREGGEDELRWIYRNPDSDWTKYGAVLMEPVTLWRGGKGALDPVPTAELRALIAIFERAVRDRLGESFRMVADPGPGVMRIRLAVTEASLNDSTLDVLTARAEDAHAGASGPLDPATREFLSGGVLEGEIRDTETNEVLAQGVDQRREGVTPAATWADVRGRIARWADRTCSRLEARTGR